MTGSKKQFIMGHYWKMLSQFHAAGAPQGLKGRGGGALPGEPSFFSVFEFYAVFFLSELFYLDCVIYIRNPKPNPSSLSIFRPYMSTEHHRITDKKKIQECWAGRDFRDDLMQLPQSS